VSITAPIKSQGEMRGSFMGTSARPAADPWIDA
jgi:hypothetical protein